MTTILTVGDSEKLFYKWSFQSRPSGSKAKLSGAETQSSTFTSDVNGEYVVNLKVNDGKASSGTDSVLITVLEPEVALYVRGQRVDFPYSHYGTVFVSPKESETELGRFRIEAIGKSFTIENFNVEQSRSANTPPVKPQFVVSDPKKTVKKGGELEFDLVAAFQYEGDYDIIYTFDIAETGEKFRARYKVYVGSATFQ